MEYDSYSSLLLTHANLEAEIEIAVRHRLSRDIIRLLFEQKTKIETQLNLLSVLTQAKG